MLYRCIKLVRTGRCILAAWRLGGLALLRGHPQWVNTRLYNRTHYRETSMPSTTMASLVVLVDCVAAFAVFSRDRSLYACFNITTQACALQLPKAPYRLG